MLSVAYNWGYRDILFVSLNDLDWLIKDAREEYKNKELLRKALLSFMGVKDK